MCFGHFVLQFFVFLYARTAPANGQPSPFELRFGKPYNNVESLHPFGSTCYFLEEQQLDKPELRGRLGIVFGYGRLHSYVVLDLEHHTHGKGQVRIIHTRDVRFLPEPRFGFCPNHASHFMSFRCFELMPLCRLRGCSVMMLTLCLQQLVMMVGASCANCGLSVTGLSPARLV